MARRPQRLGVPPREEDRHRRRHLRSERRQERHRSQAKRTPNERVLAMLGFRVEPGLATRQHRDFELEVDTNTWQLRARIAGIVGRLDVGPVPRVTVFGRGPTVGLSRWCDFGS